MWAFQYCGAKIATQELGPIMATLLPMAAATVLLGLMLISGRRKKSAETVRGLGSLRHLLPFIVLGAVCSVERFCLISGVKYSLASNASVIVLTIPVLTALLATLLVGEKMSRYLWISFALAIVGVVMVSDVDWRSVHIFHGKYLVGNALILASCFLSALYNAFSKRLLRIFTPLEVLVYSFIVADVVLFAGMLVFEPVSRQQLASLGSAVWLSLGIIAVFSLTLGMLLFFWVIERINLSQAALSLYLLPVFGVLISTVTLKEKMRWQLFAGGILVIVGTLLATKYGDRMRT
jgi:drug/metabolite transporter (DMT)-like permease